MKYSIPLSSSLTRKFLAGIVLALPLTGQAANEQVLVKIGSTEIHADEILPYLKGLSTTDRSALSTNPAVLNQLVRTLVLQELLYKEATQAGWEKKPEVQEQLERARKNALVENYLTAVTKVPEGFPTEAEITAAYNARKDSLQVPQRYRLAQIFVAAPKGSDKATLDAAQLRLEAVRKALKQSDFATVAQSLSEETQSGARGGEVGWLAEEAIQPEIKGKVKGLSVNAVSEAIRLDDGWYFIKVLEESAPHIAKLEEVKPQLVQLLRQERVAQNRDAYISRLQQQNPVSINEIGVEGLLSSKPQP